MVCSDRFTSPCDGCRCHSTRSSATTILTWLLWTILFNIHIGLWPSNKLCSKEVRMSARLRFLCDLRLRLPWKPRNCHNAFFLSLVASEVVITTSLLLMNGSFFSSLPKHSILDYYTALAWWHKGCRWSIGHGILLAGIILLWLDGLNICWDCLSRNELWADMTGGNFHCFS